MITATKESLPDIVAHTVALRSQLRDTIRTLSNARRAEAWEIVNELIEWEKLAATAGT